MVLQRLQSEFKRLQQSPPGYMFLNFDGVDLSQWKIIMTGPIGSPYETSFFHIHLSVEKNYPISPPFVIFESQILHPNVSDRGLLSPPLLAKDWKHTMGIEDAMLQVQHILIKPCLVRPYIMNNEAWRLYTSDLQLFKHLALKIAQEESQAN